jgi:hypothetical protein
VLLSPTPEMSVSQSSPLNLRVVLSRSLIRQQAARMKLTVSLSRYVTLSGILIHLPKPEKHRHSIWSELRLTGMSFSVEMTHIRVQERARSHVDLLSGRGHRVRRSSKTSSVIPLLPSHLWILSSRRTLPIDHLGMARTLGTYLLGRHT